MRQHELKPAPGSRKRRKRVARGDGSGHGSYAGRGLKGQKSRSGGGVRRGFEGGQLPLMHRLPSKRGFTNIFRPQYSLVNVGQLGCFAPGEEVTPQAMLAAGLIKSVKKPIKVLGDGEVKVSLVVHAHRFSASARTKVEAAGGRVEVAP